MVEAAAGAAAVSAVLQGSLGLWWLLLRRGEGAAVVWWWRRREGSGDAREGGGGHRRWRQAALAAAAAAMAEAAVVGAAAAGGEAVVSRRGGRGGGSGGGSGTAVAAAPATLGWEVEKSEGWEGADSNETHQITTVGGGVVGVRRACNIRLWGWLMVSAARTCDTSKAVTHGTTEESSIL